MASNQQVKEELLTEDVSETTASTPPVSPTCPSESPTSPLDVTPPSSTETSAVKPRRRGGRPRPRPISDYGQLISRKHSIPEEVVQQHAKERTPNACLHKDCIGDDSCENGESPEGSCVNGDIQNRRQRPVSVIGGVDLLTSNAEEKDDPLSSVSLYIHLWNLTGIVWLLLTKYLSLAYIFKLRRDFAI